MNELAFLAAFGFLQVEGELRAINMTSISELCLLSDGRAEVTTVAGGKYVLPADQFQRLKAHCEGVLSQYAKAQTPSNIIVPKFGRQH